MKKIFVLLLAAVVCLSLAACGGDSEIGGNSGGEQGNEGNHTGNPHKDHPFLQFLYGEWEYEGNNQSNYPFAKLNVNKDGTCLVDGAAGTWTISSDTSDGRLYIDVLVDNQKIGVAEIYLWAGHYGFGVANTMISQGDNWKHNTAIVTDDNDIVLTTENWHNYFNLITEAIYSENAFGEVERLTLIQYLMPKEEYEQKILANDLVFEMKRTANRYYIDLNAAEKSYTLGEMIETTESSSDIMQLYYDYQTNRYDIDVTTNYINAQDNADPDSMSSKNVAIVPDIESIEMLRIQGNIYMVNE